MRNILSLISRACMAEAPRSGRWPTVRKNHLVLQPFCKWCGSVKDLEVHHIEPFHLCPAKELDPANLITLCETLGVECHFVHGHFRNWKTFNPQILAQAVCMHAKMMLARGARPFLWLRNLARALTPTTILDTIEGVDLHYQAPGEGIPEVVTYTASLQIDGDGSGPSEGDPCYQKDTTLHKNNEPLNALVDRFIAIPPQIIMLTIGKVLGSWVRVTRISTGKFTICVVGDVGPRNKIGEASECVATDLGDDANPIDGGDDALDYFYEIYIGQAAPGYTLQGV